MTHLVGKIFEKTEVIKHYNVVKLKLGRVPKLSEIYQFTPYRQYDFKNLFAKTYVQFVESLGDQHTLNIYNKDILIKLLKENILKDGRMLTNREWDNHKLLPCTGTYERYFGSIRNVLNIIDCQNPRRKGRNKFKDKRSGYILIYRPKHSRTTKNNYIYEHRLVMEGHLGRPLESYEYVHHKNAIRDDNRIENLQLMTRRHHLGKVECPYCRKEFLIE